MLNDGHITSNHVPILLCVIKQDQSKPQTEDDVRHKFQVEEGKYDSRRLQIVICSTELAIDFMVSNILYVYI